MTTYYKPCARDTLSGNRVQQQDLSGVEYTIEDEAWMAAQGLAEKQNRRGGNWVAYVQSYSKTNSQ